MQRSSSSVAAAVVCGGLWLSSPLSAKEAEPGERAMLAEFLVGDYALVGQQPDSTTAYSGTARIALRDGELLLKRRVGGHEVTAQGRFEVPQPPGEGSVLRFRWNESAPVVLSCLVGSDLDNYARLTCTLIIEGQHHRQPGIEAWFPTATWSAGLEQKPHD